MSYHAHVKDSYVGYYTKWRRRGYLVIPQRNKCNCLLGSRCQHARDADIDFNVLSQVQNRVVIDARWREAHWQQSMELNNPVSRGPIFSTTCKRSVNTARCVDGPR
ncbi:hypothetical protein DACRYDRAFT_21314 [Dacryopinax primogenitus]|uniref:Uncharacterized protein n=1 Tax=Dacryopinax primogenitus (strain DJM 731) TaxID=1858805 RepID=M5GF76_DACPD|nr:uncharacterized protein DACRYDRAFT_21314 [Dacryopinax primogenitus]EJU03918.1 hypothetical protein DACRYDRAFT_21314 [Dacryopinax primogenitus]